MPFDNALTMLRDSLGAEGFYAAITPQASGRLDLVVGMTQDETTFTISQYSSTFYVVAGDDFSTNFETLGEAATFGFDKYGPRPKWELLKDTTLWQHLMGE